MNAPSLYLADDTGSSNSDGITNNGTVIVTGLATGASWQYSTDAGASWLAGTDTSFELASGSYGAGSILVRQVDLAGNSSAYGQLEEITVDTNAPAAPSIYLDKYAGASGADGTGVLVATFNVGNLEAHASWEYSPNGEGTWHTGTGTRTAVQVLFSTYGVLNSSSTRRVTRKVADVGKCKVALGGRERMLLLLVVQTMRLWL
jgi:hypothetical protein